MRTEGFPRTFGQYLLLSSLGRGGMGEVFLAKKRALDDVDRLCIVKTLRGDLVDSQEYVRRFLDEARVVVQLNHAHICQVYETGKVGHEFFLAMEYIAGVNVKDLAADLQREQKRVEPGLALYLVSAVLDALAFAHRFKSPVTGAHLRVVHRDVSPANVMVSFDGDVKLIDFGLAESSLKTENTETRLVMGKVAYMAPEQARGDSDIDGSADQFAAAVMLYELLSGDRYYGEMNTHQIWQVVGHGGHVPRSWMHVPDEARDIIARALDASAKKRFVTCDAMRDALDELRAQRYPRSNKGAVRELMRQLYGDRAVAEQDLITSFADLRAPDPNAAFEPMATEPALSKGDWHPPTGTEPWRNSPSSTASPAAGPGVAGEPVRDTLADVPRPEVSMTSPVSRPSPRAVEPSEALVLPKSPLPMVLLAAGALAGILLLAVFALGGDAPRAGADAGVIAGTARDAGVVAASLPPAPPAPAADAGIAVPSDATAEERLAAARQRLRDMREKRHENRAERLRPAPAPPPTTPATTPPLTTPPAQPAKRTYEQNLKIVQSCDKGCAEVVLRLLEKKEGPERARAYIIGECAANCVGEK